MVLTQVCETALKEIDGFQWLTHLVNYSDFPKSLKVICIFDTNEKLLAFTTSSDNNVLRAAILSKLNGIGIKLKSVDSHISYDSEESCAKQHNGNWANRLTGNNRYI
ncbi:MAG: Fis family transcriptional regulator [Gammaproteobacteria bacterium]|nr:MAG: Fis family transcriptional regulator [Gammaproteobacteria bacterium]